MSVYEIVASHRGSIEVDPTRALRLAWGLAFHDRPWDGPEDPLALPTLPGSVRELHDIPRAVTVLAGDRFDGDTDGRERDLWRPDISISGCALMWQPIRASRRYLTVAIEPSLGYAVLSWDSGTGDASRFLGRCVVAALGSLDLRSYVGIVALRPCVESAHAVPLERGAP